MEGLPKFEDRESIIDNLISKLAENEGMNEDDILCDIIVFAPYEGNELSNPDYLDEVADRIGISYEEMREYANKKAKEQTGE